MNHTDHHVIEIPAGQGFIEAGQIPNWIAERLVSVPNSPPLLATIEKRIPEGEPNHWRVENLTHEDVEYLFQIWAGLDVPPALNMTKEQWAVCKRIFETAADKPGWEAVAVFRDYRAEAEIARQKVRLAHFKQLEAEAKADKLRLLDANRVPTSKLEYGTLISVEDASAYLAPLGFELRQPAPAKDAEAMLGEEQQEDSNSGRLVQPRIDEILRQCKLLEMDPMNIPWGGKRRIETECRKLNGPPLRFTESTFEKAWKQARKRGVVQVENVVLYRGGEA